MAVGGLGLSGRYRQTRAFVSPGSLGASGPGSDNDDVFDNHYWRCQRADAGQSRMPYPHSDPAAVTSNAPPLFGGLSSTAA